MKPKWLVIHHSGGRVAGAATLDRYHMERSLKEDWNVAKKGLYRYLGYNKVILPSGKIEQGRDDDVVGNHCIGFNSRSLGICIAGNMEINPRVPKQWDALIDACARLCIRHYIPVENILGHRETPSGKKKATACPGKNISMDWVRKCVRIKIKELKQ